MKKVLIYIFIIALIPLAFSRISPFPLPSNPKSTNPRILVTHKEGLGEREMAARIQRTAVNMNLECSTVSLSLSPLLKRLFPQFNNLYIKRCNPDIIISLQGGKIENVDAFQFAALTHGSAYYFSPHSKLPMQDMIEFDALLVSFPDRTRLHSFCNFFEIPCNAISWYTTCPKSKFLPVRNFNLVYFGSNFANLSFGKTIKQLFSRLDRTTYFSTYGEKEHWLHTPKSYRGFIPFDGQSVSRVIHNNGVALILHSPDHYKGHTPTGKIFEACAASAIVISDRHPFIVDVFGDNVLYIDMDLSSEQVFKQIEDHMKWIWTHRDEAQAMAKRAHEIFISKYTLEKQIDDLLDLYNKQQHDKKNPPPTMLKMGL